MANVVKTITNVIFVCLASQSSNEDEIMVLNEENEYMFWSPQREGTLKLEGGATIRDK